HDQALAALRERWESNPQWAKLAAVALAYPDDSGRLKLASVVVHSRRPFLDRLSSAFPSARVYFTVGASADPPHVESPRGEASLPEDFTGSIWLELFAGGTHGGAGWEHGTVVWSPTRDRGGADRYAPMRLVKDGDLILHSVAGDLVGFSRAAGTVAEVAE